MKVSGRKLWLTASLASVGIALILTYALAAVTSYGTFRGDVIRCPMGGLKGSTFNGISSVGQTTVDPSFRVTDVSNVGDDQQYANLTPVTLEGTTNDPRFGTITWRLDDSRTAPETTVRGIFPGKEYPAQVDIYAYATAQAQNITFRSTVPVHLVGNNVKHFKPFNSDASFTLNEPVVFESSAGVTFTLNSINFGG